MPFGDQFHIDIRKPSDPWDSTAHPDKWFRSTEDALRHVAGVQAGKALLKAIQDSGFWVAMEPLNFNVCNAHGGPRFTVEKSRIYKGVVKFDAAVFEAGSRCFESRLAAKHNRGGHADEVLFHEMIHALRGGLGLNQSSTMLGGGLWRYNTVEEFYAVVITNIYISDATNHGSSGLRAGHRGKMALEKYFSQSVCFFASSTQVLPMLDRFRSDHKNLFDELAKVDASFNPLRAMVKYPVAVRHAATAPATREHERGAEKHQKHIEDKRLAEVRKSIAATAAKERAEVEALKRSIANATPQQVAEKLGGLAYQALDVLSRTF